MSDERRSDRHESTIVTMLDAVRSWLSPGERGEPEYHGDYVGQLNYEHIETAVVVGGKEQHRCNLCGALFDDMGGVVIHVAEHDRHVGDDINPFARCQEDATMEI